MKFLLASILIFCGSSIRTLAFESSIYPGEQIDVYYNEFPAKGGAMLLRDVPFSLGAVKDTIYHPAGGTFKFNRVRFRTVNPGLFLAQTAGTLKGHVYGKIFYVDKRPYSQETMLNFAKGDTIEYLQYTGEFWKFLRLKGTVIYTKHIEPRGFVKFKELRRLQFELWFEIVDFEGNARGWYDAKDHQPGPYPYSSAWPETEWLDPDPFEF